MWNPISSAPSDRSLELAVIDNDGVHALVFPCEKASAGWKNAVTGARVDIRPTHWRAWSPEEDQRQGGVTARVIASSACQAGTEEASSCVRFGLN